MAYRVLSAKSVGNDGQVQEASLHFRRLLLTGAGMYCVYIVLALIAVFFGLRWVYGLYRQVIDATISAQ